MAVAEHTWERPSDCVAIVVASSSRRLGREQNSLQVELIRAIALYSLFTVADIFVLYSKDFQRKSIDIWTLFTTNVTILVLISVAALSILMRGRRPH